MSTQSNLLRFFFPGVALALERAQGDVTGWARDYYRVAADLQRSQCAHVAALASRNEALREVEQLRAALDQTRADYATVADRFEANSQRAAAVDVENVGLRAELVTLRAEVDRLRMQQALAVREPEEGTDTADAKRWRTLGAVLALSDTRRMMLNTLLRAASESTQPVTYAEWDSVFCTVLDQFAGFADYTETDDVMARALFAAVSAP